jgi:hypothetical protein
MQDVDHPADIQAFPQPARARRPRVEVEPLRVVLRPEDLDRLGGHPGRWRDVGERLAVRSSEAEHTVGRSIDLVPLLVDRAMVPAAERFESVVGPPCAQWRI